MCLLNLYNVLLNLYILKQLLKSLKHMKGVSNMDEPLFNKYDWDSLSDTRKIMLPLIEKNYINIAVEIAYQ